MKERTIRTWNMAICCFLFISSISKSHQHAIFNRRITMTSIKHKAIRLCNYFKIHLLLLCFWNGEHRQKVSNLNICFSVYSVGRSGLLPFRLFDGGFLFWSMVSWALAFFKSGFDLVRPPSLNLQTCKRAVTLKLGERGGALHLYGFD